MQVITKYFLSNRVKNIFKYATDFENFNRNKKLTCEEIKFQNLRIKYLFHNFVHIII